jgi:hypothetical protein
MTPVVHHRQLAGEGLTPVVHHRQLAGEGLTPVVHHRQLAGEGLTPVVHHRQLAGEGLTPVVHHRQLAGEGLTPVVHHRQLAGEGLTPVVHHRQLAGEGLTPVVHHRQLAGEGLTPVVHHRQLAGEGMTPVVHHRQLAGEGLNLVVLIWWLLSRPFPSQSDWRARRVLGHARAFLSQAQQKSERRREKLQTRFGAAAAAGLLVQDVHLQRFEGSKGAKSNTLALPTVQQALGVLRKERKVEEARGIGEHLRLLGDRVEIISEKRHELEEAQDVEGQSRVDEQLTLGLEDLSSRANSQRRSLK